MIRQFPLIGTKIVLPKESFAEFSKKLREIEFSDDEKYDISGTSSNSSDNRTVDIICSNEATVDKIRCMIRELNKTFGGQIS